MAKNPRNESRPPDLENPAESGASSIDIDETVESKLRDSLSVADAENTRLKGEQDLLVQSRNETLEKLEKATEELDAYRNAPKTSRGLTDNTVDRVGSNYPASEREARLLGREEQVMLAAVMISIVKVIAEDEGKETTPEFVLDFVLKAREPYLSGPLNPQPLTGNEQPRE